ncbi:hypothetical protein G6L87_03165 [Agrobacterium rhizogenes]|nr:hypothetical protein [Rhizobium rhizogenes]
MLNTASGLFALSSLVQLKESGWFDRVIEIYGDDEKFPFGPPSHITRWINFNPDKPILSWVAATLFLESRTAAYLAVTSILTAIAAGWL